MMIHVSAQNVMFGLVIQIVKIKFHKHLSVTCK